MSEDSDTSGSSIASPGTRGRQARKEQLRQEILGAATELFVEHGYENFSLRQVAQAIGYSPTTIYLYFANKDELLFLVAMEGFRRFGEMLEEGYERSEEPLVRLKNIGQAYLEFSLTHPVHYRLMFMQRGEFLQRDPPTGYESVTDSFGILQRTVKECLDAGVLKAGDPMEYSAIIWASVHGIAALAIGTHYFEPQRARALYGATSAMMMDGIRRN